MLRISRRAFTQRKSRRGAGRAKAAAWVQLARFSRRCLYAVCLRTGTEVELLYIPAETQRRFVLTQEAAATFKTDDWWRRDIFVLKNGRKVVLGKLLQAAKRSE